MSDLDNTILEAWSEVKALITTAEVDVVKNAKGNAAAGVRARRALRLLKNRSADLVKLTISEEKTRKTSSL
tara:strand:+ start:239 stop:451 length:213 start_codon:yes stop_codon:yes gene_type:complete